MKEKITVVLVDSHTLVRKCIKSFFDSEQEFLVVGETGTGQAAIEIALSSHPDVLLLDFDIQDMPIISVVQRIKHVAVDTQIIILSSYREGVDIVSLLRAGALSYVGKDVSLADLTAIVQKVARGETMFTPHVSMQLVEEIQARRPNDLSQISARELEVLLLIGKAYSNAGIAEELMISERTVKNYVTSLLSKFSMNDRTQLAVFVWQRGLLSRPVTEPLFMDRVLHNTEPLPLASRSLKKTEY